MTKKTIKDIKVMLTESKINDHVLNEIRQDERKGVRKLLRTYERKQEKEQALLALEEEKRRFDAQYNKVGTLLAGVDEAGRGPLAGPVTAAAVILPDEFTLPGLTDSKQLNEAQRNLYFDKIKREAIAYHIAIVEPNMIDQINIYEATKQAMTEAILALNPVPAVALIDAVKLSIDDIQTEAIIKGDDQSLVIAAASILAKVKRDELMQNLHMAFPAYEFATNKGYGTKAHLNALKEYGPCSSHRKSFAPVSGM